MKGTEKQIRWANDILAEARGFLNAQEQRLVEFNEKPDSCLMPLESVKALRALLDEIEAQDDAKLIIDNRNRISREQLLSMGIDYANANR